MNFLLVFSFVALWHDLTFRLLAWGWLVVLFIMPEIIATLLLPEKKVMRLVFLFPDSNSWRRYSTAKNGGIDTYVQSELSSIS